MAHSAVRGQKGGDRTTRPTSIGADDPSYPASLGTGGGAPAWPLLEVIGDSALLERETLGLVCSVRCPGSVILATYEFASRVPLDSLAVAGGFHSPMERQCLEILLARHVPTILCPARPLRGMMIRSLWRVPISEGRLLILSPFVRGNRRATEGTAYRRNLFVAALCDTLFVPYASPGGSTERVVLAAANCKKRFLTVACNDQTLLKEVAAVPIEDQMLLWRMEQSRGSDETRAENAKGGPRWPPF